MFKKALIGTVAGLALSTSAFAGETLFENIVDGGMNNPDLIAKFHLYPGRNCTVEILDKVGVAHKLNGGTIYASMNGENLTINACWIEKNGRVIVYDEKRREYTHSIHEYEKVQ